MKKYFLKRSLEYRRRLTNTKKEYQFEWDIELRNPEERMKNIFCVKIGHLIGYETQIKILSEHFNCLGNMFLKY